METNQTQKNASQKRGKKKLITVEATPPWRRFFFGGKSGYAMQTEKNEFIPLSEAQVKQHLRLLRVTSRLMDEFLCKIREEHYVVWIGPVAGYRSGIHFAEDSQNRILVTVPPKVIPGVAGEYELIMRIFSGLFKDKENPRQFPMVLGWLKQARLNVVAGIPRPLPALALVGPRKAGKSLFLEIVRHVLGGRKTAAFQAMTNESGFNSELLGAELLTVDDEVVSNHPRKRIQFGQAIKKTLFAGSLFVHGKGKEPFCARPVHALAIAVNNEPQHVRVLPELDPSLEDKIALIQTGMASVSVEETSDRDEFMRRILSEIPAFIHFLEEEFKIPHDLLDVRTGIKAYHHPEVLDALMQLSPEIRLLELINKNEIIQAKIKDQGHWKGSSLDLEQLITTGDQDKGSLARSLTTYHGAIGGYLSKLADSERYGVKKGPQKEGIVQWLITPPALHPTMTAPLLL
jgi:hypothetical protein